MARQGWEHGSSRLGTWLVISGDMACYEWGHGLSGLGIWLVMAGDMACYGWVMPLRLGTCLVMARLGTCLVMTGDMTYHGCRHVLL